ncbi:MAG: NAD(P)-binding domain-containing protein [Flavobacteriales bacterium]|nr:NAD(P)-binding domain-containing protein [Flavobacteriales bacterium]
MKKIGIIGSGTVAKVLAKGFLDNGCEVMMGTRDTSKLEEWKSTSGDKAHVGSMSDAADFGEVVVLAVKGRGAIDAVKLAGVDKLAGKTLIDTTNPIDESVPPSNGVLHLFTGPNESLLERIQAAAPEARVVKSFSCVGNAFMVNPSFTQGKPTMFICGNHEDAKTEVSEILVQFGWDVEDIGKAEGARAIEPLVSLWCAPGFLRNHWNHAFALFRK